MRKYLIILLCIGSTSLSAQKMAPRDTFTAIQLRSFSDSSLNVYKADRQFQYNTFQNPESLWDRFWNWFWDRTGYVLQRGGKPLWIVLGILGLVAILLAFLKARSMNKMGLFDHTAKSGLPYEIREENIHTISFNAAISKAELEGNYRLAIRLQYLQVLKNLNILGLIKWRPDKTNFSYIQELRDNPSGKAFERLTGIFEYAWYGNKPVTDEYYAMIKAEFDLYNQQF